jgi:SAM-dependent methyltransferase
MPEPHRSLSGTKPPFGKAYAAAYDSLYADKDYAGECDIIEALFRAHGGKLPERDPPARADGARIRDVLDLGCGTGRHAVEMGRRGYRVVGSDRSEAMLALARAGATEAGADVIFITADMADGHFAGPFDACVCMFASLGYAGVGPGLDATLANVRAHLQTGGLFIFEVWYGPAVLAQGPTARWRPFTNAEGRTGVRSVTAELEPGEDVCVVKYELTLASARGGAPSVAREEHRVRYFFRETLEHCLADRELELVELTGFPDTSAPPSEATWNVIGVARAL